MENWKVIHEKTTSEVGFFIVAPKDAINSLVIQNTYARFYYNENSKSLNTMIGAEKLAKFFAKMLNETNKPDIIPSNFRLQKDTDLVAKKLTEAIDLLSELIDYRKPEQIARLADFQSVLIKHFYKNA